jgi:hypothetical protein
MISWTERPGHRLWLHTEALRLLDFGRGGHPFVMLLADTHTCV